MFLDGWVGGWMDGWVGGSKSRFKDCLQQSKTGVLKSTALLCVQCQRLTIAIDKNNFFLLFLALNWSNLTML
jgi:hypothetical protein